MFITHNSDGVVRIPAELAGKPRGMPWHDYCRKIWHAVRANNCPTSDIQLTLHTRYVEWAEIMNEMQQWNVMQMRVAGASKAAQKEAERRLNQMELHGVKILCDAPEFF